MYFFVMPVFVDMLSYPYRNVTVLEVNKIKPIVIIIARVERGGGAVC